MIGNSMSSVVLRRVEKNTALVEEKGLPLHTEQEVGVVYL